MTLLEIGAQYDEAAKALGQRIRELRAQNRATEDPDTAWPLQRRIEELIPLRKEARQLSNLCLHYYERSFWRSELYTFNDASQRVPGRPHRVAEKPQAGTNDEALERLQKNLTAVIRDELTPKQQEVLQLYYFEGLRMKDIAERLKVNRSTVSRNLMRAQRKLAKYLKYSL